MKELPRRPVDNPYQHLTSLNETELRRAQKARESFELLPGTTIIATGISRDSPSQRVDLGILRLTRRLSVNVLGIGTSTKEELAGMNLAFLRFDIDAWIRRLRLLRNATSEREEDVSSAKIYSDVDFFLFTQGVDKRLDPNLNPKSIGSLVITARV